tara:strand:- start:263 stop:502 length:240 start_codon:yes stop_codon:yes gene_type:complete
MTPLVKKIRASGSINSQKLKVKKLKVNRPLDHSISRTTTKKGDSRALVAVDGSPVSYEPIDAPRSLSLSRISKKLRIPK